MCLHVHKTKTECTCHWHTDLALAWGASVALLESYQKNIYECEKPLHISKKIPNLKKLFRYQKEAKIIPTYRIPQIKITPNTKMQQVEGGTALPQHTGLNARGHGRLCPQWVPLLQSPSRTCITAPNQGSQTWVHTAVTFCWGKLCVLHKVVLKFNLWSAWQRWEQWVATLMDQLKLLHQAWRLQWQFPGRSSHVLLDLLFTRTTLRDKNLTSHVHRWNFN